MSCWLSPSCHNPKNRSYTNSWCSCLPCSPCHPFSNTCQATAAALPAQSHPSHQHPPWHHAHIEPLLLRKHLCGMCNPLPPNFQTMGKASSSFVCADVSRRQVVGVWADGLSPSFLSSSHLPPFSKDDPSMLAPAVEPRHLPKHPSLCSRDGFTCEQAVSTSISQSCSSNPSFIATP